jgi:hypothetical protein
VIQVTLRVKNPGGAGKGTGPANRHGRLPCFLHYRRKNIAHYGPSHQSLARLDVTWFLVLFAAISIGPGLIVHVDRLRILSLSAHFVFFPYFVLTTLALRAEAVRLAQSTAI